MASNALKVRTTTGKPFHRCGLAFGGDWAIVPAEKLAEKFGSPKPRKNSPTIGEILEADKMLICLPAEEAEKAASGNGGKNGGGKNGGGKNGK